MNKAMFQFNNASIYLFLIIYKHFLVLFSKYTKSLLIFLIINSLSFNMLLLR